MIHLKLSAFFQILLLPLALLLSNEAQADDRPSGTDGKAIIKQFLEVQTPSSEMALVRMQRMYNGERRDDRRFLTLYQKEADNYNRYLLRVIRPKEAQGVTFLAVFDPEGQSTQSIYLPSIGKSRPLIAAAQATPFLGSDFNYVDLINEIPGTQKYSRLDDVTIRKMNCYAIRALPREEGGPYLHRDLFIEKETYRLVRIDYYDVAGKPLKTLNAYDYDPTLIHGNSKRPHRLVMTHATKATETIFTVIVGRVGEKFDSKMFTPAFVEAWSEEEINDFMFQFELRVVGE
jgi:hypothetical protein